MHSKGVLWSFGSFFTPSSMFISVAFCGHIWASSSPGKWHRHTRLFVWSEGYIIGSEIVYMYGVIPYSSEHSDLLCTVIRLSA